MSDLSIQVVESVRDFPEEFWSDQTTPFMQRAFWLALEDSGAISAQTGWFGQHLIVFRDHEPIAAALFFKEEQTLYGRYWGAIRDVDCLHFEVCYYQGIEYAIQHDLRWFDPGTQGEHKLIRGFAPIYTHSMHWLAEPAFMAAIVDFTEREKVGVEAYFEEAMGCLPYKNVN